jgi:hypothetical protein
MTIKAVYETQEEIPESLKGEYLEVPNPKDRAKTIFVVDVDDGIRQHPKVTPLNTSLETLKAELKVKKTELAEATEKLSRVPQDFDPDKWAALLEDSENKGRKIDQRIEQVRAETRAKAETELVKPLQDRVSQLEQNIRKKVLDEGLTNALVDANVSKELLPAARAFLASKGIIKLNETGGEFVAEVENDLGIKVGLKDFVTDWTLTDEGKPFVSKPRGGGAEGTNGGTPPTTHGENPWAKGQKNLTKQQQILQSNPTLARQLAAQAGEKLPAIPPV